MSLRFICIELRENLHCANVFLQFDNSLTLIKSLKIKISSDQLILQEHGTVINFKLSDHLSLDPGSLSNLAVEKLNASFRFSISTLKFKEELRSNAKATVNIEPLFRIGDQGTFVCGVCTCMLMATDTFVRTREFPSGAIDTSEFFCHAATEFKDILVPRICDLYYGFDFLVVNAELLENTTKFRSDHIYCKRCLQHLGETLFNGKAVKIWGDTLKLRREEENEIIYVDILPTITVPKLIKKIVSDCTDATDPVHSIHSAKVLISTSSSKRSTKYLMIQILEKELKVLRNEYPFKHNYLNANNNVEEKQLSEHKSFKLLYKFFKHNDQENAEIRLPALLQFWQQDISIQSLKISPTLFSNLLEELEENSLLIPEFYRFNNNDFKLSYIFYK